MNNLRLLKNWIINSLRVCERKWHWKQIKLSNIFVVCLWFYVAPYGTWGDAFVRWSSWWPNKCFCFLNRNKKFLIKRRLRRFLVTNYFLTTLIVSSFVKNVRKKNWWKEEKESKVKFIKKLLLGILSPFHFAFNKHCKFNMTYCSLLTSLSFHSKSSSFDFHFPRDKFFWDEKRRKKFLLCVR